MNRNKLLIYQKINLLYATPERLILVYKELSMIKASLTKKIKINKSILDKAPPIKQITAIMIAEAISKLIITKRALFHFQLIENKTITKRAKERLS